MRPAIIQLGKQTPWRMWLREVEHVPYHWHETVEVIFVRRGHVQLSFGPEDHRLKAGDIAVANVNEIHRINDASPQNRLVHLHVDPGYCERSFPGFGTLLFYCSSAYEDAKSAARYGALRQAFLALAEAPGVLGGLEYPAGKATDPQALQLLDGLLRSLIDNFDYLRWAAHSEAFDDKRRTQLQQIATFLKSRFTEKLALKDIARAAGVGPHHLSHLISGQFGHSMFELLAYHRLEASVKMLLSTRMRIVDIANACGFSDVKYLIQGFKEHYGCTPSEFRKRHYADDQTLAGQVRYRDLAAYD